MGDKGGKKKGGEIVLPVFACKCKGVVQWFGWDSTHKAGDRGVKSVSFSHVDRIQFRVFSRLGVPEMRIKTK